VPPSCYDRAVTVNEALAKLGLSRHASPEEARRAYLRLLKKTRPEANQDEFIALRDAYECVRGMLEFNARFRVSDDAVASAEQQPKSDVVHRIPTPTAGRDGEPRPTDSTHAFPPIPREPVVADVAKLVVEGPREKPVPPREEAVPTRTPAEEAMHLCDQFDAHGHEPDSVPPIVFTLRLIFSCLAARELKPARALSDKLSTWLRQSGRETFIGSELVAAWVTARELAEVAPVLPPPVLAPIAEAALAGDLGQATQKLTEFRKKAPSTARAALTELKIKAPWLATAVGPYLVPPPRVRWRWRPTFRWPGSAIPIVVFMLIRVLSSLGTTTRSSSERPVEMPRNAALQPTPPAQVFAQLAADAGPAARLKQSLGLFFQLTRSVAGTMEYCNMPPAAELVRMIEESVRRGDCSSADNPMIQLQQLKPVYAPEQWQCASEDVETLHRSLTLICAEAEKVFGPRNNKQ